MKSLLLAELIYPGMIGLEELMEFYDYADENSKFEVDILLKGGNIEAAWAKIKILLQNIGKLNIMA